MRQLKYFHIFAQNSLINYRRAMGTAKEGCVEVELPNGVFYNPVQEINRDLTVSVIRSFQKLHFQEWVNNQNKKLVKFADSKILPYSGLRILEALAASGLRSIRFCKEIPYVNKVIANDLDSSAVELIKKNAIKNMVTDKIFVSNSDAIDLLNSFKAPNERFHVVDIDPYGTASPFLDSAMKAIDENGLLCITSTDMAVLCGSTIGTALGKYGGLATKCSAVHEQGIRILLHAIQSAASRHGKVVDPLLSLSIDFYARIYCRIRSSPKEVKSIATKTAIMFTCPGCYSHYLQPLGMPASKERSILTPSRGPPIGPRCSICESSFIIAGPLYFGKIHNREFIEKLIDETNDECTPIKIDFPLAEGITNEHCKTELGAKTRMLGLLYMAKEELEDVALYFIPDHLASIIKTPLPRSEELRSAFTNAGYLISESHCQKNAIKTNAPWEFVWHVMRSIHQKLQNPSVRSMKNPQKVAEKILSGWQDGLQKFGPVSFEINDSACSQSRKSKICRFPNNPPNWGPKSRPNRIEQSETFDENISNSDSKRQKVS